MEFVHTEIEQTTKVRLVVEMSKQDVEMLYAIFAADIRVPEMLEKDGDLRDFDFNVDDLKQFMNEMFNALYDVKKRI